MTRRKITVQYDDTGSEFSLCHKTGADKFGGIWLCANRALVDNLRYKVEVSDPAVKELLSSAAYHMLVELEKVGWLRDRAKIREEANDPPVQGT